MNAIVDKQAAEVRTTCPYCGVGCGVLAKVAADGGGARLVLRDSSLLRAGEARAYLPGDIHDTRCLTENALLFRFTERDLRHEDQVEHKLSRFVERDGYWTAPRP